MNRRSITLALSAIGLVIVAGSGFVLWRTAPVASATPTPTRTVVIHAPTPSPSVKIERKIVHRTRRIHVLVPGPTVTVTPPATAGGGGSTAYLTNCINVLFQNIQSWTTFPGRRVPNGWWDARCPTP